MFTKQTFDSNIYMKFFRILYIGLIANLCLWLINLPFSIAALILEIDLRNIVWFGGSLLFIGPGMISMLALIDQWIKEKDIEPIPVFFNALKYYGLNGFLYWGIGWLGTVIAIMDMIALRNFSFGHWLYPFFFLISMICLSVSIQCWYFQIRNPEANRKNVLKISLYYSLKKWYVSLLNLLLLGTTLILIVIKPQFGLILTPIFLIGLIYLNMNYLGKEK